MIRKPTTEYVTPVIVVAVPTRWAIATNTQGTRIWCLQTLPGACPHCCTKPTHKRSHWFWFGSIRKSKAPVWKGPWLDQCWKTVEKILVVPEAFPQEPA